MDNRVTVKHNTGFLGTPPVVVALLYINKLTHTAVITRGSIVRSSSPGMRKRMMAKSPPRALSAKLLRWLTALAASAATNLEVLGAENAPPSMYAEGAVRGTCRGACGAPAHGLVSMDGERNMAHGLFMVAGCLCQGDNKFN